MNIIILTKNYEKYTSGYYHHDINKAFMKRGNCYLYGKGYPDYDEEDTIQDVIAKSSFNKEEIDLIVVGTSWEREEPDIQESDPHPSINLSKLNIPKIFFLNKEYKKLDKKLEYAARNRFALICTSHHKWEKWAAKTGLNFLHLPFAADPERYKDYELPLKYDFGFTGSLHMDYTDIRYRIKCRLFKSPDIKSNVDMAALFKKNPVREEFRQYRIYWAEWGARRFPWERLLPVGNKYVRFLNSFKTFLSTPSAFGLIGTRYFECMATKTLLFCPESEYYDDMFRDGYNCVIFKEDLSDFTEKLRYMLRNDSERQTIIENSNQDFLSNHTYDKRIEKVLSIIFKGPLD
jgi:glycosyltransferase involved in cell wall biosynthesis